MRARALVIAVVCAAGVAAAQPDPGSGAGSGAGSSDIPAEADDPSAGSGGAGSGGAGSAGAGSAGAGSAGAGSGSARILQLPTDIAAPQVSAAASPTEVRLGGKFTVFLTATYGEGVEVNIREPIELGGPLEVTRKVSEDRKAADGRHVREWQLEVIAWELGDLVVPPIAVTYTAFGRAGQVRSNTLRLRVTGVLGEEVDDPKALRDPAPPAELWRRDWFWLWIAAGGAAVIEARRGLPPLRRRRRRRRAVRLVGGAVLAPRRMDAPRRARSSGCSRSSSRACSTAMRIARRGTPRWSR